MANVIEEVNTLPVAEGVRNAIATALQTLFTKAVPAGLPDYALICLCSCSFLVSHPAAVRKYSFRHM